MDNGSVQHISILKISEGKIASFDDMVAVEEPLEIQLEYSSTTGRMQKNIAVTMRTPGNDKELAAGFLFTEAVIKSNLSIQEIKQFSADENRVLVILKEGIEPVLANTARNFYATSSCGVCGKASIDAIVTNSQYRDNNTSIKISASVFYHLQNELRKQQKVFEETGGIHACAIFDIEGEFIMLREDVGRHNALDKLIGAALLNEQLPLTHVILLLSGRASFELLQKAAMAGIKVVASVGAPTSMAVDMAKENNITLIGFLRDDRYNIYTGYQRINAI